MEKIRFLMTDIGAATDACRAMPIASNMLMTKFQHEFTD